MINLIFARSINRGIGYNGKLPWYFKEELKYFSKLTKGNGNNAIIMGRKTWDSLPLKPLNNRVNIILSSNINNINSTYINHPNIRIFNSISETLHYLRMKYFFNIWIIGGKEIYDIFLKMDYVDNIYETVINKEYICDTFIDEIPNNYKLIKTGNIKLDNEETNLIQTNVYTKQNK